ncbi:MAG: hypothetical protein ABIQ74_03825 [Chitinophagales bacterium]
MKGNSSAGSADIFGMVQVPSAYNTPPSLYNTASGNDSIGNLWRFGGAASITKYVTI